MIPDYQTFMLPLLRKLSSGNERRFADLCEDLAQEFSLSEGDRAEMLASGTQLVYVSRIGWARTYLGKAGLLESPRRGVWKISQRGMEALAANPLRLDNGVLKQFAEFREFTSIPRKNREAQREVSEVSSTAPTLNVEAAETPEEALARVHQELDAAVRFELLTRMKAAPPAFFERLVVDLMLKMGYGGSRQDAGEVVGKTGDGGIDGVIKQDRLGLDMIYLQAKRWEGNVGEKEVRDFVGSLEGHRAKRGVFITTSSFTRQAVDYANRISFRVILIDGDKLATLMIEHDLGVSPVASYVIKRVDGDYFEW